eukprot:141489-Alexandrium_andersonii.AAC.1
MARIQGVFGWRVARGWRSQACASGLPGAGVARGASGNPCMPPGWRGSASRLVGLPPRLGRLARGA